MARVYKEFQQNGKVIKKWVEEPPICIEYDETVDNIKYNSKKIDNFEYSKLYTYAIEKNAKGRFLIEHIFDGTEYFIWNDKKDRPVFIYKKPLYECIIDKKFDENNRLLYIKDSNSSEVFFEYDDDDLIHVKESGIDYYFNYDDGVLVNRSHYDETYREIESAKEFDKNRNLIYEKNRTGETFFKYDEHNKIICINHKFPENCEKKEETEWYEYENGLLSHLKSSTGIEYYFEYDSEKRLICCKDSGNEVLYLCERDSKGKLIHLKNYLHGYIEKWYDSDTGNIIHLKNYEIEELYEYESYYNGNIKKKICYRVI